MDVKALRARAAYLAEEREMVYAHLMQQHEAYTALLREETEVNRQINLLEARESSEAETRKTEEVSA